MDSKFQIPLTSIHTYPVQSFSVYPEITCFKMTVLVKRQKQTNKQKTDSPVPVLECIFGTQGQKSVFLQAPTRN